MGIKMPKFNDVVKTVAPGVGLVTGMFGGKKGGGGMNLPEIPKFAMRKTDDFIKNDPSVQIGGPNGANAIARRYGKMREMASNRIAASNQGNAEAMKRQFASQGMSGSGAEIAAMQKLQEQEVAQKSDALGQVDIAESQEIGNRDLAQADMDFKQRVFNFERGSKMHELDLAERQQQQDAVANEINARVAAEQSKPKKGGFLSGLLDGIL